MLGPYIKSRGTRGTEMSANSDIITMETYVQQGENYLKTSFSYMSQNVKNVYFGLFRGADGVFNNRTGHILFSNYPLTHKYVHVK